MNVEVPQRVLSQMKRLGLFLLAAFAAISIANEKGDALVKQIEAVKDPTWVAGKEDDKAFMDKYLADIAASTKKRNALILQLYKTDPNHAKTAGLMRDRWNRFEAGRIGDGTAYSKRVLADIDAVLQTKPPVKIVQIAEAAKIRTQMDFSQNWDPMPAIDAYIAKYPKDPDSPQLMLSGIFSQPKSKRTPHLKKFLQVFPDSSYKRMVNGALRQMEGVGKPFALSFTDAVTGKKFDIADHKGKVVVIDFWATWCGPCIAKMPDIKKVLDTYGPQGLEVVGISLDQPEKEGGLRALREFVAKNKYGWWQYYQGNGWASDFSSDWGISSIPSVFLIDKKGILREIDVRNLEEAVTKLLEEAP